MHDPVLNTERDYYEVLGVERDADDDAIKKAYRARARELHPDVSGEPDADRRFSELAEAYAVLSKSSSRLLYDRFGYRGRGNGWFGSVEGTVTHATLFDFWPTGKRRAEPKPVAEVDVDPYEAARGTTRKVRYAVTETCPSCGGGGGARGAISIACSDCGGTGRSKERTTLADARLLRIDECSTCVGTGKLHSVPCPRCFGLGEVSVERAAVVDVPPGTADDDRVALVGAGDGAVVVVRVRSRPDPAFVRYAAAVLLAVAVAFLVLLLTR